jgi:trans-2,3-dihydro-3-hydroxyanthranilate isomerase
MPKETMQYVHVDVFSPNPFFGNSLTVFPDVDLSSDAAHFSQITKEMRHFESIFLRLLDEKKVSARVFDLIEELPFAGHPVIGAGCVLHMLHGEAEQEKWSIQLPSKSVEVTTFRRKEHYFAELNQGQPEFFDIVPRNAALAQILAALSLNQDDLHPELPAQVASTGLNYLVLPLRQNLEHARIISSRFEELLRSVGAQFVYVLRVGEFLEGRHWNNDGIVEDIATGSGAGCVAAYLVRQGYTRANENLTLNQGRFVGRPSRIALRVEGDGSGQQVIVGGEVAVVGRGELNALPRKMPC